jgi:hypothetical protein
MKNHNNKNKSDKSAEEKKEKKKKPFDSSGRRKTTIPEKHKAPDTDEEGIGVVHKPQ